MPLIIKTGCVTREAKLAELASGLANVGVLANSATRPKGLQQSKSPRVLFEPRYVVYLGKELRP